MTEDVVVVDVESQYLFEDVGGRENLDKLGVGVAVVYSYRDNSYDIYSHNSVKYLKERLLQATSIVGYNSYKFDLPVIWGMKLNDFVNSDEGKLVIKKSNDLLRRIWQSINLDPNLFEKSHYGYSLASVAAATIGRTKGSLGKESPSALRNGLWDVISSYCLLDVQITTELNDFIDKYQYIINERDNVVRVWAAPDEGLNKEKQ